MNIFDFLPLSVFRFALDPYTLELSFGPPAKPDKLSLMESYKRETITSRYTIHNVASIYK